MHKFGPFRVVKPQCAGALLAEMALAGALLTVEHSMIDLHMLNPLDLKSPGPPAQVDGEAVATGGLAADGAIAALVGIEMP